MQKKDTLIATHDDTKRKKELSETLNFKSGILMWFIILSGYFLFVLSWFSAGYSVGDGTSGWSKYFFDGKVDLKVSQSVNYLITFFRAIGSLLVGWAVVKFTHKYAVIIALTFLTMSIPSVLIGWATGGTAGFVLFIIFRAFLAVGGTTLIVLLQPVIAKSVRSKKTKGLISTINPWGFNTAYILMTILFVPKNLNKILTKNWFPFSLAVASLTIIVLILYIVFGKNFQTTNAKPKTEIGSQNKEEKQSSFKQLFKEKQTWIWIVIYSGFIITAVMPILFGLNKAAFFGTPASEDGKIKEVIGLIPKKSLKNFVIPYFRIDPAGAKPLSGPFSLLKVWSIVSVAGVYLGALTIGKWNTTNARRKPFCIFITSSIVVLFVFSFVALYYGSDIAYLILGLLFGVAVWGIQGVILNSRHETPGENPRRIGIFFGIIWGAGYFVFTIANIILASVSPVPFIIILVLLLTLMPIGLLFARETKPNGGKLPETWTKKLKKQK